MLPFLPGSRFEGLDGRFGVMICLEIICDVSTPSRPSGRL